MAKINIKGISFGVILLLMIASVSWWLWRPSQSSYTIKYIMTPESRPSPESYGPAKLGTVESVTKPSYSDPKADLPTATLPPELVPNGTVMPLVHYWLEPFPEDLWLSSDGSQLLASGGYLLRFYSSRTGHARLELAGSPPNYFQNASHTWIEQFCAQQCMPVVMSGRQVWQTIHSGGTFRYMTLFWLEGSNGYSMTYVSDYEGVSDGEAYEYLSRILPLVRPVDVLDWQQQVSKRTCYEAKGVWRSWPSECR